MILAINTVRWRCILRLQRIDYPLRRAALAYAGSFYIGLVTPGRLGELVRALYLRADLPAVSWGRAVSGVVADRLLDIAAVLLLGYWGLSLFLPASVAVVVGPTAVAMGLAAALLLWRSRALRAMAKKLLTRTLGRSWADEAGEFTRGLEDLATPGLARPIALLVLVYAVFFVKCYLVALALRMSISLLDIGLVVSLASPASLIPISISGLGTREAALVILLRQLGVGGELAASYAILWLLVFWVVGVAIGAVAWFCGSTSISVTSLRQP